MKIGFIGFGGAGYGLAKGLRESGLEEIYFFEKLWNTPPYDDLVKKRAAETGAVSLESIEALLKGVDLVVSCVTGTVAIAVAEEASAFLSPGHLYADVNTTSPTTQEKIAGIVEKTGAQFVDVAMMGAIPAFLHRVPILASGRGAVRFKESMEPFGMNITVIGAQAGQASAIKMLRSIFMKGLVALLLETLNATHRYNVDAAVLGSIAETMEKNPFMETVRLQVTKGVANAERMAHEMEEVLSTLKDMNVPFIMSEATEEKLKWCSQLGLKEYFGGEIPETLVEVLDAVDKKTRP